MRLTNIFLSRFSYATTETEGILNVNSFSLATIERPWISGFSPGGKPFASCIPDGEYTLEPWVRPNGDEVYILSNSTLGVYKASEDRPSGQGRYLILAHRANFVTGVIGCIAVGTERAILHNQKTGKNERAVSNSEEAMRILREQLGRDKSYNLIIRPRCGTGV